MRLKQAWEIGYGDLKGLEKPENALSILERECGFMSRIENLDHYQQEFSGFGYDPYFDVKEKVRSGQLWLVSNSSLDPLVTEFKTIKGTGKVDVTLSDCLSLGQKINLETVFRDMLAPFGVSNEVAPPPSPTQSKPRKEETADQWFDFTLLLENGEPLPNQDFKLTDSTGKEHTGTTDDQGHARVQNLKRGACELEIIDIEDWRTGRPNMLKEPAKQQAKAKPAEKSKEEEKKEQQTSVAKDEPKNDKETKSKSLEDVLKEVYEYHDSINKKDCGDYVVDVAKELGISNISDLGYESSANQIVDKMMQVGTQYKLSQKSEIEKVLKDNGLIIVGVKSSGITSRETSHGHVGVLRPGNWIQSGSWGSLVPLMAHRVLGETGSLKTGINRGFGSGYKENVVMYHVE